MHTHKTLLAAAVLMAASGGVTVLQTAAAAGMPGDQYHARNAASADSKAAVTNLERAAQRLRESIQAMADQPVGPKRDQAMRDANHALLETNQAMIQLPAAYRYYDSSGAKWRQPPAGQTFEQSMSELRSASDRLYNAVHAMARESVGPRLSQAIRDANEALVETHGAMAWVYDQRLAQAWRANGASTTSAGMAQGSASSNAGGTLRGSRDAAGAEKDTSAIAGGIGINARARLSEEAMPEHNVKMVFALDTGNYVADVHVKVMDRNGRAVVDGTSHGPWLYAKLPPGSYTAIATYEGHTAQQKFTVGRSGQRVATFRWPASVEQASAAGVAPILGTGPEGR